MQIHRTYQPKVSEIDHKWHLIDAEGKVLGRLATRVAVLLSGKHKKSYTPHMDIGDYVVVVNAGKVAVTGRKEEQKKYYRHSGYPGGLKVATLRDLREKSPTKIIELAVKNMLPSNKLRSPRMNRLKVFPGLEHPYKEKFVKEK